jgi:hypothetical protein
MISFPRISAAIAGLCLIGAALYYYKTHYGCSRPDSDTYQLADQRFLVHSSYGFPILSLDKSTDEREAPTLPFIFEKLIAPQSTILHLGTHAGLHTILAGKQLKDGGKVLAFEGHPKLFALLKENIKFHQLDSVISPFSLVPSSQSETLSICLDATSTPSADTTVNAAYEQSLTGSNCYEIQLKPLDSLSLPKLDFILIENDIDVPAALEGAYALLEKSNWPPILIVPSLPLTHTSHQKWIARLKKQGYYFYQLKPTGKTSFTIRQINPHQPPSNGGTYLFFSRELLPLSLEK